MDLGLRNKVIMVAGASRGLGFAIARAVALEGAHVSIASPTESRIHEAASKLCKETVSEVIPCVFEAVNGNSIVAWFQDTCSSFGGVDGLVVNAGGPSTGGFDDFTDQDWKDAFEFPLLSSVRMIRAVLPSMRERGGAVPWGRFDEPDEFGRAGAFLLSEAARYITGETLVVDGGAMKAVW